MQNSGFTTKLSRERKMESANPIESSMYLSWGTWKSPETELKPENLTNRSNVGILL